MTAETQGDAEIAQRSRAAIKAIHEPTRCNTKSRFFGDLGFVIIRVISWIVMFRQNFAQIIRSFAIASQGNQAPHSTDEPPL